MDARTELTQGAATNSTLIPRAGGGKGPGMIRFGLLGIPVTVQWWFWLSAALLSREITSTSPGAVVLLLGWLLVAFASLLWHELGHALMFKRFGRSPEILLGAFGGVTTGRLNKGIPEREELIITAAGPVFGFLLWLAVYGSLATRLIPCAGVAESWGVLTPAEPVPAWGRALLRNLQQVNLWWTFINLLPVGALDGARILELAMGPAKAREASALGVGCGVFAAVLAMVADQFILAVFFGLMTSQSFQKFQAAGGSIGGSRFRHPR